MQGTMEAILNEVKKVVTGKDDAVLKVMLAITAGGHILIDDILVWERPPWRWGLPRRWDTDVTEYSSHLMSCLRI